MDHAHQHHQPDPQEQPQDFWERRYAESEAIWSGRANPRLVEMATDLAPGTALDLGCGEGGDAIWLAQRGWQVTGVDIATTALDRVRRHAAAAGVAERIRLEQHDLARSFPAGEFDLVSAQFLQTPLEFPRTQVLRAAAAAVARGGLLVVVEHGALRGPWMWATEEPVPAPEETLAVLDLDPAGWDVVRVDAPEREATGPDGQTAMVSDHLVAVRRG